MKVRQFGLQAVIFGGLQIQIADHDFGAGLAGDRLKQGQPQVGLPMLKAPTGGKKSIPRKVTHPSLIGSVLA